MGPSGGLVKRKAIYFFLMVLLLTGLVTCAEHKTYWLYLRPHPGGEQGPKTKLTIGLLPFEDARVATEKLGARILRDGTEEPIRLESPSASEDLTDILRRSLEARNIPVVTISAWVPAPQNLKDLPPEVDIAIAGKIEDLEVEARSSILETKLRCRVKLSAKLGLKAQGKVVTETIEVRPEESVIFFKRQKVEEMLNEAVASALNRLVEKALASSS
jgi:hypothetical protein